jgi:hypothetical protein
MEYSELKKFSGQLRRGFKSNLGEGWPSLDFMFGNGKCPRGSVWLLDGNVPVPTVAQQIKAFAKAHIRCHDRQQP